MTIPTMQIELLQVAFEMLQEYVNDGSRAQYFELVKFFITKEFPATHFTELAAIVENGPIPSTSVSALGDLIKLGLVVRIWSRKCRGYVAATEIGATVKEILDLSNRTI